MHRFLLAVFFSVAIFVAFGVADNFVIYGVSTVLYSKPGDIYIGSIMTLSKGVEDNVCTNIPIPGSWGIEYPEAIAFAVDALNKDPNLLPNLTLGFYILDDCYSRITTLAQALSFIPKSGIECIRRDNSTIDSIKHSGGTLASKISHYKVVGTLAPLLSSFAVPISYLYTSAHLPIVGYGTTSDELSDKSLHPNYVRVISPEKYQALAMLMFISDNGWTYVSVVYSQGSYGERAYDTIKSSAASFNICLAVSYRILDSAPIQPVAESLLNFPRARVVILFLHIKPTLNILDYI